MVIDVSQYNRNGKYSSHKQIIQKAKNYSKLTALLYTQIIQIVKNIYPQDESEEIHHWSIKALRSKTFLFIQRMLATYT
jgi:hypothetical protein